MINLISKSMRTKIIERGWKKERERRNWIDSISLSSPSMRLFSVDWRRWRCGHFLALWTAKKSWTPRSWTKRAGPGHARLSGTETGNLFGELHPVAFLVFPSVSPTYLCAPPECPMFLFRFFFFFSLTFEEEWNLEAGPSSSRLESSVRHSFLYLLQLFQVLETRRRFFMKYTRFIKGEENFFLKLEQQ